MTFLKRLTGMSRELKLFAISSLSLGMAFAMFDTIFNNFLNSRFTLSGFQRSFLEFPRELPGFLVIFISMLLWFLCSRRLGAVALALGAVGVLLVGFVSSTYAVLVVCLFIYSLGQHVFLPLAATIGMELASDGKTGQRLGQLNAVRNLATIIGSFVVYLGFKFLGFTFQHVFALSAAALAIAAVLMFLMKPQMQHRPKTYLTLHREYRL
ncbi:MAG: MFS transporter, partial [Anaerolineaceae bacterium]|nr:MFS transporter [Anaerolineaceae bacterium]